MIPLLLSLALLAPVKDPVPQVTLDLPLCFQMPVGDDLRLALEGVSAAWLVEHLATLEVTPVAEPAVVAGTVNVTPGHVAGGPATVAAGDVNPAPGQPAAGPAPVAIRTATVPSPALVKPAAPMSEPWSPGIVPVAGVTTPAVAAPVAVVEATGGGPTAVGLAGVDAGTVTAAGDVAIVLAKVQAGDRSAATMTQLAALSTEVLVQALERSEGWRRENQSYADALAGVLLAGGRVDPSDHSLSRTMRRAVADSLARRGDGQCVAVYETLLKQYESEPATGWVPELHGLAKYWRSRRRLQLAADTWLRGTALTSSAQVRADFVLEASLDEEGLGHVSEALALRDQARSMAGAGDYLAGLAAFLKAQTLLAHGGVAESLEMLSGVATDNPTVAVLLNGLRCRALRIAGQLDEAAEVARQVITAASSPRLPPNQNVNAMRSEVGSWLRWHEHWELEPVRLVAVRAPLDGEEGRLVEVMTRHAERPGIVASDGFEATFSGEPVPLGPRDRQAWQHRIAVRRVEGGPGGDEVRLTVGGPGHDKACTVAVQLVATSAAELRIEPPSAFFGRVQTARPAYLTLRVPAAAEGATFAVATDRTWVQAEVVQAVPGERRLTITLTPPVEVVGLIVGSLAVTASGHDSFGTVHIPYSAFVAAEAGTAATAHADLATNE